MAKNNRWKTGGNKRVALRSEQRKSGSGIRVYFGSQSFGVSTVRSLNRLLQPSKQRDKIMKEWLKVRDRMTDLIKEGYTFTGRLQDIYNGFLHNTKRELDFLKQMTKRELRVLSASYKGIFDTTEKMNLLKQERAAKAAEERRRKKEAQDILEQQRFADDIALEDLDDIMSETNQKIRNIVEEEQKYIEECFNWSGYVDEGDREECIRIANEINRFVEKMSPDDQQAIIDFWENTGGIDAIIQQNENRYYGMFYDAAIFNAQLLNMTGLTGQELQNEALRPDRMSASDFRYVPAHMGEWDVPFDGGED